MKQSPQEVVERQRNYILSLEDRLRDASALASRAIQLEHDLAIAQAGVADLKHKLFLIGSEEAIQAAIEEHSVGLGINVFTHVPLPKINIKKKPAKRKPRP